MSRNLDAVAKDWAEKMKEIDKIKAGIEFLKKEEDRIKPKLEGVEREMQKLKSEEEMLNKKIGVIAGQRVSHEGQLRKAEEELMKITAEKHKLENEK